MFEKPYQFEKKHQSISGLLLKLIFTYLDLVLPKNDKIEVGWINTTQTKQGSYQADLSKF